MGTYAYDATNNTLDLIAGRGNTSSSANKTDLTAIILTGTTNTSGNVISAGTWFYLNGTPCVAKVDIASGATFTEGTNYEEKTIGSALSELNSKIPTLDYHIDNQIAYPVTSANTWIKVGTFIPTPLREYRVGTSYAYAEVRGVGVSYDINATSPAQYIESNQDLSNFTMSFMTKYANIPIYLYAKHNGTSSGELLTIYAR